MKKLLSLQLFFFLFISANASNYYWVNGSGIWSDYTNHWAISSGGSVFHVQPPTPLDSVFFDGNSFLTVSDTLFLDSTIINCSSFVVNSPGNNPRFNLGSGVSNNTIKIYGSLIILSTIQWGLFGGFEFYSSNPGNVVNTSGTSLQVNLSGATFYPPLTFSGSGSWALQNDLILDTGSTSIISPSSIVINDGIFYTNSYTISCGSIAIRGNSFASLGTSHIKCGNWDCGINTSNNVDADSSFIECGSFMGGRNNEYSDVVSQDISYTDSCTFHDITTEDISQILHSTIHNAIVSASTGGSAIYSDQCVYNKMIILAPLVTIEKNNIFDTLIFGTPGMYVGLKDLQTVNSYIQLDGTCSGLATLTGSSTAVISKPSGSVVFNYVSIQDITATGGATFTANNSIDGGNVTGITINSPSPSNMYWVGGTGNWDDVSHWSTSSGGVGGSCVPSVQDSVFFDANSFPTSGDTIYLNVNAYCKNLDFSAATNNPVFKDNSSQYKIFDYGSFIIHGNVKWDVWGGIIFKSSLPGNVINTSGNPLQINLSGATFYPPYTFSGSGSWALQNDLILDTGSTSIISPSSIVINDGIFYTNSYTISCGSIAIRGNSFASLGTSHIKCGNWDCGINTSNNVDADSSFIECGSFMGGRNNEYSDVVSQDISYTDSCTFHDITTEDISQILHSTIHNAIVTSSTGAAIYSDHCVYNKMIILAPLVTIEKNNIFDTLIFGTPGMYVGLKDLQTVNSYIQLDGTCSGLATLIGSSTAVISKPSGSVVFNYVSIQDITTTGGATFTANNSIDGGNVTGITINSPSPSNMYWVGGTGNWDDVSHWSTSSGGVGGSCVPSVQDSVFFDANSFPTSGDTIYLNVNAYCKNLDFSAATNNPVFKDNSSQYKIFDYGSFIIHGNVKWDVWGGIIFKSSLPGNVINTSGNPLQINLSGATFYPPYTFSGSGSWALQNDLILDTGSTSIISSSSIVINDGIFYTNSYTISCGSIAIRGNSFVSLGTSHIKCGNWDCGINTSNNVDADSSFIECGSFMGGRNNEYSDVVSQDISYTDSCTFHDITTEDISQILHSTVHNAIVTSSTGSAIHSDQCVYNKMIILSQLVTIEKDNIFDTLIFNNPGMNIILHDTQIINNSIYIQSDPAFPTSIHGGTLNFIDTLCADYIYVQNNTATGGGHFYAGDHSVDQGGNTGWTFASCAPIFSNVWPGDANYDLIVDNIDLLYIGIAYGDTGYVRAGATNNYVAQPCQDWFYQFQNTTNVKKADSDGNGIIETADTVAISLNYGLSHPFRLAQNNQANTTGTDLILQMPAGQAVPGTNVNIPIILGTGSNPATDVYGIAFTINFEQSMVQQGSLNIDFTNCWIEQGNNHLSLVKDFSAAGKCDLAFTRIDGNNITGNGIIGNLSFTVANNAMGFMHFTITKIKLISHDEIDIPVATHADSTYTSIDQLSEIGFSVFPNPSKDKVTIQFNNKNHNEYFISLYDVSGQIVYRKSTSNDFIEINGKEFESGMYYVLINDSEKNLFRGKILFY